MSKASIGKRILAYLIDAAILFACIMVFMVVVAFGGSMVITMIAAALNMGFLAMLSFPVMFIGWLLAVVSSLGYWLLRDGLFGGRSLGKKLMGLKVVTADGKPCNYMKSLLRNITLCVPLLNIVELIMPFVDKDGLRFGDKIAGTQVIA